MRVMWWVLRLVALIFLVFRQTRIACVIVIRLFECWIYLDGLLWMTLDPHFTIFNNVCVLFAQDRPKDINSAPWLVPLWEHILGIALPDAG